MRRKFFTSLTLLISLNLLIKPFWIFGIDRTVQNVVGAQEYGLYFSLFNFSILFNILLDLGITNYNNRNIAQNNQLLSKSLSSIIGLKFLLAFLYAMVAIIVAFTIGYEIRQFHILLFLILNQFISSFILYLRSNLSGMHYFKTDSIISVLDRVFMIIICGFLLWGGIAKNEFKIEWLVYSQTLAYFLTLLISLLVVYGKASFLKLNFDKNYFVAILKQSYPFALLGLLMAFYYRVDSVMIERLLPDGKQQAGIYAQGFRILDAAAMFAFLYAGLLLPMFSRMLKRKESIHQLTMFSFLLLLIPVLGFSMASFFYKSQWIDLLYHQHIQSSADIFGVLMLCLIGISVSYIFGTLLTANGNLKALNIMASGGVVLNIGLNLILIPKYYALGAAIASLITQSAIAIVQIVISKKIFNFQINRKKVVLFSLFLLILLISSKLSIYIDLNWIYKFLGLILLSIFLAFALKLFKLRVLFDLMRNED